MRATIRTGVVAVMSLALAVTGCGTESGQVTAGESIVANTSGPSGLSHGGPVQDHVSLVDRLRAEGVLVEIVGSAEQPGLRPAGTRLRLTGAGLDGPATLESYNYDATDLGGDAQGAVARDAGTIAPDGTPNTGGANWHGPAHWYRADRLLVLYPGSDPAVLSLLTGLLGEQFAGD